MELQAIAEEQHGTGFVHKDLEASDRVFAAGLSEPVDWYKGFDVQDELKKKLGSSFIIPVNDQGRTLSCVGQAWAKYASIKKVMGDPNPNWVEFSPRDIYSHIVLPGGGAYILTGGLRCKNSGVLPNEQLPPYWSGKPNMEPLEEVMKDRGLEGGVESGDNASPDVYNSLRQLVKGGSIEHVGYDIESIARAIRDNWGIVVGVYGENNGTWLTKFPRTGAKAWGHGMLWGGFKAINGNRYIKGLNTWGKNVGEGGWQWFGEEWFQQNGPMSYSYIGGANTWSPEVGRFQRIADYERLQQYLEANGYINQAMGDKPLGAPEVWKEIQERTGLDITYSDWSNYAVLIRLK